MKKKTFQGGEGKKSLRKELVWQSATEHLGAEKALEKKDHCSKKKTTRHRGKISKRKGKKKSNSAKEYFLGKRKKKKKKKKAQPVGTAKDKKRGNH